MSKKKTKKRRAVRCRASSQRHLVVSANQAFSGSFQLCLSRSRRSLYFSRQDAAAAKDAIVMLIDCNASMLTPTADFPEGALSAFLASCAATMKEKIVGNSTDLVSIGMMFCFCLFVSLK
jgi:hypothetical protein